MPSAVFASVAAHENPQANALLTLETVIDSSWIDYNGHMTEWHYYRLLSDAGEHFLHALGFTEDYRIRGFSFFSVQGVMRNLRECQVGTSMQVLTEMIGFSDTQLHIYQYIVDVTRGLTAATGEHMMVHVDTNIRKRAVTNQYMTSCLQSALRKWPPVVRPKGLGLSIMTCA